jgi:preprotein translocase subunit YajC
MTFRKLLAVSIVSAASVTSVAAIAQTPAPAPAPAAGQTGLQVGATVKDTQGGTVGTITAINGPNVTVHTDRLDATVPATSFAVGNGQILFGMTQAQLNAAVDQANAQAAAAFAVGTPVKDRNGAVVGPVQALDETTVTVQLGEQQIRLPRTALAASNGALVTGATLAELQAAANGSGTQ